MRKSAAPTTAALAMRERASSLLAPTPALAAIAARSRLRRESLPITTPPVLCSPRFTSLADIRRDACRKEFQRSHDLVMRRAEIHVDLKIVDLQLSVAGDLLGDHVRRPDDEILFDLLGGQV